MPAVSPLNQRRWRNFRANRRAFWSLWVFLILYGVSLFAEFLANDVPIVVNYRGQYQFPVFTFYSEASYGGEFRTQTDYRTDEVHCLIETGGAELCIFEPDEARRQAAETGTVEGEPVAPGWMIWPPIPYSFDTLNNLGGPAPSAPDGDHWLGTDGGSRDVLARVIYGFRLSVSFALVVVAISSLFGIAAGAIQGFFGGVVDLVAQRLIELWGSVPSLYVIIIVAAIIPMNFWLLVFLMVMFSWTSLVGVVRAEFLRARNFEYVRAARALGVSNARIMVRHVLPNAMVATVTLLPFIVTGAIGSLAMLDFLGFGLPASAPSLGNLTLQAKQNLQATWLGFTAFFTFAIMLSLLVFIFEGVRDAFDPRKTFR